MYTARIALVVLYSVLAPWASLVHGYFRVYLIRIIFYHYVVLICRIYGILKVIPVSQKAAVAIYLKLPVYGMDVSIDIWEESKNLQIRPNINTVLFLGRGP